MLPCQRSFKDEVDLKNPRKQLNTSLSPTRKKKDSGTQVNCHGNDQNIANRGESQIKFKLEIELQVQSGMADSSITL